MGSSKKVTVGYKYYLGIHMVLCHGPIDRITRVYVDDRVAWNGVSLGGTIQILAPDLFGGEKREGGVVGNIDLLMGEPTQAKNTYLQGQLGTDIPAFRTVVSAVLNHMYLGLNPYLKSWAFEGTRVYTRQNDLEQWYPEKAGILAFDNSGGQAADEGPWKGITEAWDATSNYSAVSYDDSSWDIYYTPIGDQDNSDAQTNGFPLSPNTIVPLQKSVWLRKWVYLEAPIAFDFDSYVDNGVEVWVNGTKVITDYGTFGHTYSTTIPASNFQSGANLIAIKVKDDEAQVGADRFYFGIHMPEGFNDVQLDLNPAHILRECLTDPDWGLGNAETEINDTTFTAAADTLFVEGFGLSLLWDRQISVQSFINEVTKHINAAIPIDRTTGKFNLKLIRNDYTLGSLPLFDESNVVKVEGLSRTAFGDLTNSVTVNYYDATVDADSSVTVADTALVQSQGISINTTVQYPGITTRSLASRVGERDLKALSSPLWTGTIYANRDAENLNIGDVFKFSWSDYQISEIVMRVTGIAYGTGKNNQIKLNCTQDVFSLPTTAAVATPDPSDGWQDIDGEMTDCPIRLVQEAPYYTLVQEMGQTDADDKLADDPLTGYLLAAGSKPAAEGAINAVLQVNDGNGYEDSGVVDFAPTALLNGAINETTKTFPIDNTDNTDLVEIGTLCQIENEICRVDALSSTSITVGRGCLDTIVTSHADDTPIIFFDDFAGTDNVEYLDTESINVKLLPTSGVGQLALADATAEGLTFDNRAIRPYPPGNFKFNSAYFPAVINGDVGDSVLTWAHRDRTQQTAEDPGDFEDASIGPETNSTYTIRIYGEADTLGRTVTGETGTSYTYTNATEESDFQIPGAGGGDPYFSNVQLLLHCDGADEGTTFTDSSSAARTVSTSGNVNTEQDNPKFGTAAAQFDGSGDRLNVTIPAIGTQDFTLEWWCYPINGGGGASYGRMFQIGPNATNGGLWVVRNATNNPMLILTQLHSGSYQNVFSPGVSSSVANTTWHHIALVRSAGKWALYINGTRDQYQATTPSGDNITATALYIGANNTAGEAWNGQLDDIRLTIGVARYSGTTITVPTKAFPDIQASSYRINGKLRFELETVRDGYTSNKYNYTVERAGWGLNWGKYWGGKP